MINQNELLAKIVVFDSGLGSLSIIKEIQKIVKTEIVYFADQKNYPYGNKSQAQLGSIIKKTIILLEKKFAPDIIVIASNTPSLMLNLQTKKIVDVKPPLKLALKKSKSKKIGILATKSAIESKGLENYIKENNIPKSYSTTALGLGLGKKWFNSSGFVFEVLVGVGRTIGGGDQPDAIFRGDIGLGYRF